MNHDFNKTEQIPTVTYVEAIFKCGRFSRKKNFSGWVRKSDSTLSKELDLPKFVHRQRLTMNALLSLLDGS